MAQLLVRDVPEHIAAALKARAKKNGRSAEAEHRALLVATYEPKKADPWAEIDRLRQELEKGGRKFTDSTQLIREDRDSR